MVATNDEPPEFHVARRFTMSGRCGAMLLGRAAAERRDGGFPAMVTWKHMASPRVLGPDPSYVAVGWVTLLVRMCRKPSLPSIKIHSFTTQNPPVAWYLNRLVDRHKSSMTIFAVSPPKKNTNQQGGSPFRSSLATLGKISGTYMGPPSSRCDGFFLAELASG